MIHSDAALAVVEEQLALLERGLERMRREITNPRTFGLYSEAYVDQIAELRADIDAYKGRQNGQPPTSPNGQPEERGPSAGAVHDSRSQ